MMPFPFVSFLNKRTDEPLTSIDDLRSAERLFAASVHESALKRWRRIGVDESSTEIEKMPPRFSQDRTNPSRCRIFDEDGNPRDAAPAERIGLDRAAVWTPKQVERRLLDTFMGRPNAHVEAMKVTVPIH